MTCRTCVDIRDMVKRMVAAYARGDTAAGNLERDAIIRATTTARLVVSRPK